MPLTDPLLLPAVQECSWQRELRSAIGEAQQQKSSLAKFPILERGFAGLSLWQTKLRRQLQFQLIQSLNSDEALAARYPTGLRPLPRGRQSPVRAGSLNTRALRRYRHTRAAKPARNKLKSRREEIAADPMKHSRVAPWFA